MQFIKNTLTGLLVIAGSVAFAQNDLIKDDFESGSMLGWTVENFASDSVGPINGNKSAKDVSTGAASSYASQQINIATDAGEMTWQFQFKIGAFNPSSFNNFVYHLMADSAKLPNSQNGYTVGVNQGKSDGRLKLYEVTNGVSTPIFDGGAALAVVANTVMGVKVTRSIAGEWRFFVDDNGGFDNLKLIGIETNKTHAITPYNTGFVFKHSSSRKGLFQMDDILVSTGASTDPQVNISSTKNTAKEGESFTVTVKTTTAVSINTTFSISIGGTATSSDYSGVPASVTINKGDYSNSFVITTTPDAETEIAETIIFTVASSDSIKAGERATKTVYIADFTRVMHYNLLRYPDCKLFGTSKCTASDKNGHLKKIITHVQPDIFGVNEMMAADTSNPEILLTGAMNVDGITHYKRAKRDHPTASEFINMLYYNSNKFTLQSQEAIVPDGIREANAYTLKYNDLAVDGKDSILLTVIQCHLKAGSADSTVSFGSAQNGIDRNTAAKAIMSYINKKGAGNYIVMGDFNIYSSSEDAYKTFLNYTPNVGISFTDPIGRPGEWSNNGDFADIHTQSTRTSDIGDNGSGGGGVDDRFDFILTSNKLFNGEKGVKFHTNSYKVVGNDGKHFNKDINDLSIPNQVVSQEIADALYKNSDHLPVIADFDLLSVNSPTVQKVPENDILGSNPPKTKPVVVPTDPSPIGVFEIEEYEKIDLGLFPNPNNGNFTIEYTLTESEKFTLSVYNLIGETKYQENIIANLGYNTHSIDLKELAKGVYIIQLLSENKRSYRKIIVE